MLGELVLQDVSTTRLKCDTGAADTQEKGKVICRFDQ